MLGVLIEPINFSSTSECSRFASSLFDFWQMSQVDVWDHAYFPDVIAWSSEVHDGMRFFLDKYGISANVLNTKTNYALYHDE